MHRWLKYSAITLTLLLLFFTGAYAWLWYSWKTEQEASAHLSCYMSGYPMGGYKLQEILGSHGDILFRCSELHFSNDTASDTRMAYVAKFTHLRELWAPGVTNAGLAKIQTLRSLQDLNILDSKVNNAGLELIRGFSDLQDLSLCRSDVTNLASLTGLKKLKCLYVGDCKMTNSGLAPIGQMGSLSDVTISHTLVTDEGLSALAGLNALENLDLSMNPIQGPGLVHLQKLPYLMYLNLEYTDIRDESLVAFEKFHGLSCLNLGGNVLTDHALPHLAKLKNLEALDLSLTFITDRGLPQFKTMRGLKALTLSKSEVTEAGVRKLQRERPDLAIEFEPSSPKALRWDRLLQMAQTSTVPPVIDLQLMPNPPVKPRRELDDLPPGSGPRRYMAFDLNDDGHLEYFVEDFSIDNRVIFALVDSRGRLLVGTHEEANLAGERILILSSKHHGYYDVIGYDCDPSSCHGELWQFDGKSYVCAQFFEFDSGELNKVQIDRIPRTTRARWYSVPPCAIWEQER